MLYQLLPHWHCTDQYVANMTHKKKDFSYMGNLPPTDGGTDSVEKIYRGKGAVEASFYNKVNLKKVKKC